MLSVPCFKFRFTLSWPMLLGAALVFLLFIRLGFWQLERAEEKKTMVASYLQQMQQPAKMHRPGRAPKQYTKLKLEGNYLEFTGLLDNQHRQHQFGYDILTPFSLANGDVVFIDRGFVPGELTRRELPHANTPKGQKIIQGTVYYPSQKQWVLGPVLEKKEENLWIIERFDPQLMEQVLQKTVYPFIIRLDKDETDGFAREWDTVSMPAVRHMGYAVQWFAMAFAILIIYLALNLKKKDENNHDE